ncbi:GH116 family glycosyl hydrolase [Nakamurella lactea]|uniref:GH116 family glycosyl hydrolase n=1 Tax=Nakamurella lactea TaxID=459515 RepID=UPI0003FDC8DA|nr:GH116 family glycosyl hydrolase [Nakamurella lactea]
MTSSSSHPVECCADPGCCPPGGGISRRGFLLFAAGGAVTAVLAGSRAAAAAELGVPESALVPVPADKNLDPRWVAALYRRGDPTRYTADARTYIGMPVGGIGAGQLYLGGDGRLWHWDIFNRAAVGTGDAGYANPPKPSSPIRQGMAIEVDGDARALDDSGFADVAFTGQYPIGTVDYRDPGVPVQVQLQAYSPFIPLSVDDSALPATVLEYTVHNTSKRARKIRLLGWCENPASLDARMQRPIRLTAEKFAAAGATGVQFGGYQHVEQPERPDIVLADFEQPDYGDWTVTGTAFGAGPVSIAEVPAYMAPTGSLAVTGSRFVTSHDFRGHPGDVGGADSTTGTLTSPPFTLSRKGIRFSLGGGNHPGQTCLNLLVDGQVVRTATGRDEEVLRTGYFDTAEFEGRQARVQLLDGATGAWGHINCDQIVLTDSLPAPDVVFEDWERESYSPWTTTGDAFGAGPVLESQVPDYMRRFGALGVTGSRFVTSHDFRGHPENADGPTGTLTSPVFTVERDYLSIAVGGGSNPAACAVRVLVDGQVVGSVSGADTEPMVPASIYLGGHRGRQAQIEIVDTASGGWGHINCDRIVFTDIPVDTRPLPDLPDTGTLALACLDRQVTVRPSVGRIENAQQAFDAADAPPDVPAEQTQNGTVGTAFTLAPGARRTVKFLLCWNFPIPDRRSLSFLQDIQTLRRHYAARFDDAAAVARHLAGHLDRLGAGTRDWVQTWYTDSTLPHWFLERTLASASTLATSTCYLFDNGRFYGWEGVYCCAGTCEHVWNYAQSVARLFPELERDTRQRVDLGIGFDPDTGQMGFRAEAFMGWAADGECGTILRCYREHTTAADNEFLLTNWPKIRTALEFMIAKDPDRNGIIEGIQPNTLDTDWYGRIAWISGMYVAALLAGAEMAAVAGDSAFGATCAELAAAGRRYLETELWTGEYFIQQVDPAHTEVINSNIGCHIDQLFGQSLAGQVGLPRVVAADKAKSALTALYRYNFTSDQTGYRASDEAPVDAGRWFAMDGEYGLLMTTFPHGGQDTAAGEPASWAAMYFNEVWTGQEYQAAAQMIDEGLLEQGLVVTGAIRDRYDGRKRNPYNEIECGDHYARAMASHGVFQAACGFAYHGPLAHLQFDPKLSADDFAAAFTAAAGWGRFTQTLRGSRQDAGIQVRRGTVEVASLTLGRARQPHVVRATVGRRAVPIGDWTYADNMLKITLQQRMTLRQGEELRVTVS